MLIALLISIPVFISGSDIMRLFNILLWGFYFIKILNKRIPNIFVIVMIILTITFLFQRIKNTTPITKIMKIAIVDDLKEGQGTINDFISGKYARAAGFHYFFINKPISLLGDGPTKYISPFTKEMKMGISGHLLQLYAEIGILGLILSYLILYKIAFRYNGIKLINNNSGLQYLLLGVMFLSVTSNILNDASIMFTFTMFSKLCQFSQLT